MLIEKLTDIVDYELRYTKINHENVADHYDGRHKADDLVALDDFIKDAQGVKELKGLFAVINVMNFKKV